MCVDTLRTSRTPRLLPCMDKPPTILSTLSLHGHSVLLYPVHYSMVPSWCTSTFDTVLVHGCLDTADDARLDTQGGTVLGRWIGGAELGEKIAADLL
jgi:hypothetical protein